MRGGKPGRNEGAVGKYSTELRPIGEVTHARYARLVGTSERVRAHICIIGIYSDGIMGEHADFGELFSQLMAMKEHAASLPSNEKRRVAEEIVTAFWRAIGGDLIEIEETPN